MTSEERLNLIRSMCQKDEGASLDPSRNDIEDEMKFFRRHTDDGDEITAACMDAVFEGGQ